MVDAAGALRRPGGINSSLASGVPSAAQSGVPIHHMEGLRFNGNGGSSIEHAELC
jgi:hypothetical protein